MAGQDEGRKKKRGKKKEEKRRPSWGSGGLAAGNQGPVGHMTKLRERERERERERLCVCVCVCVCVRERERRSVRVHWPRCEGCASMGVSLWYLTLFLLIF